MKQKDDQMRTHPGASLRFHPKPGELVPACEICRGDDWREAPERDDCDLVCAVCHGAVEAEVAIDSTGIWWLSFVGEEGSRGVCIIKAPCLASALQKAYRLKLNPGGEVRAFEMPNEPEAMAEIEQWGVDVHIPLDQLRADGYKTTKELEAEEAS
jgi:hypothetical protein